MMNLYDLAALKVPEGEVMEARAGGALVWKRIVASYVSFGDSIAGGHAIDENWAEDYGAASQYGINGNKFTVLVPGCYTYLMNGELAGRYGESRTKTTSFARSGDRVDDLIDKLSHETIIEAVRKADIVTACIGANDVLEPALSHLGDYISYGDLTALEAIVEENLARLADDTEPNSYKALFDRMKAINPNAKFAFMTVYNPYKYLYLDDSEDGFFDPLLDAIPQITILGLEVDKLIRNSILQTSTVQTLFSRVNILSEWAEKYVTKLNEVLADKIAAAGDNFILADAKAMFDAVPDRQVSAQYHYNDLVNVEFTRGYDWNDIMWTPLWYPEYGNNSEQYWIDLATKYISINGFDANGFAGELVPKVVERIIQPNVDPHPEPYGHQVLLGAFECAFGWQVSKRCRVTYNANGGSGSVVAQEVAYLDGASAFVEIKANAFTPGFEGHYFAGWNTKPDGSGTAYQAGQVINVSADITLYAQWALKTCTLTYKCTVAQALTPNDDSRNYHQLWIDGSLQERIAVPSSKTISVPYGSPVGIVVQSKHGGGDSYITRNGAMVSNKSANETYDFVLTGDITINFEWHYWITSSLKEGECWVCLITG